MNDTKTKGKTALDAQRGTFFWLDPMKVVLIGLDTDDGPEHFLYDERVHLKPDPIKVENVKANGVEEAIDIVKDGDRILAGNGRQRVLWARQANKENDAGPDDDNYIWVPALIRRGDALAHEERIVYRNELRENDTPYMKALKAQRLLSKGRSEKVVAKLFGVGVPALKQWLKLLEQSPETQKALREGKVSASEVLKSTGLRATDQDVALGVGQSAPAADAPRARRAANKGGPKRPGASRLRGYAHEIDPDGKNLVAAALLWAAGDISEADFTQMIGAAPKTRKK